jgi:hypothetical protein
MTHPLVVHCKKSPHDVYVGRPSEWGNPFSEKSGTMAKYRVKTRAIAIARFEECLLSQPELVKRVKAELRGKILGCWCAPKDCHADIIARIANE